MLHRRKFLQLSSFGLSSIPFLSFTTKTRSAGMPVVVATWDAGINANKAAWNILRSGGHALDAVEKGVMVTENEQNCCVGLKANPDRDGFVTLDASIMDEHGNCGSVGCIERIKHPVSVARLVMEKTPHVFLVGEGAQQFALSQGFTLEPQILSDDAKKNYEEWLKKSDYKPQINIENLKGQNAFAPRKLSNGTWNHDTIGMLALDANGNVCGSCTTSGAAFKMHGRVGDSPIIGAGLFIDNEVGGAVSTGLGEENIKIAGSHLVVENMRNGMTPENACKAAIERIIKRNGDKAKDFQLAYLALNKQGEYGSYCIQKGFNFAVCNADDKNILVDSKFFF